MSIPQQPPGLSKFVTLTLFIFVVISFLLLFYRTEMNAHDIEVANWDRCQGGVAILERFNAQQRALAEIEATAQYADPTIGPRLVKVHLDNLISIPDCGPRP